MGVTGHIVRVAGARLGMPKLIYAHYGVTHRCNMRCRMCVVWKTADRDKELNIAQVRELAQNLAEAGVKLVTLGGGEPFLRTDLPQMIEAFWSHGAEVRVLTNGIGLSDEKIDAAIAAGMSHVSISLDSLDPAREKEIYGQDVWNEIVDTMKRFRSRLNARAATPIMNVVVSRLNLDELVKLVKFAENMGFFCSFVPVTLAATDDKTDGFAGAAPELAVRPEDHAKLTAAYKQLVEMKRRGAPIANSSRFLRDSIEYLKTGKSPWKCHAGQLYVSVSPEGRISICHKFPALADFSTKNLQAVFSSPEAVRQREACTGCMRPCWAEVTHAMYSLAGGFEAFRTVMMASAAARSTKTGGGAA